MDINRRIFIAIGSNLGNRIKNCQKAIDMVCDHKDIELVKCSSFYETRPADIDSNNWFINAVFEIRAKIGAEALMEYLLNVEKALGRDRAKGPDRTVDLDLLYVEGISKNTQRLTLPHPRFFKRDFVLMPWAEIAPNFFIKELGRDISSLLRCLEIDPSSIYKVEA